jgi:FRG domain
VTNNQLELGPVDSAEALISAVAGVSAAHPDCLLLFRGQNNLHPTVRSGLSRPDVRYEQDVDRGLSAVAGDILGHESTTAGNIPFRKAVLQHYGYKTHYVDLTADPLIAAWFATNKFEPRTIIYGGSPFRKIEQIRYVRRDEGIGYVLVLAFPNADELKEKRRLFDISALDPFLRPSRQEAWLLYDRKPLLPDPNEFWVASIGVDCSKFSSTFSSSHLFPLPADDAGFKDLLGIPFVEVPGAWLGELRDGKPRPPGSVDLDMGMRALPVPEYVHSEDKDEYNHKWTDETLTEPKPMQAWVKWKFDLGEEIPGIRGDIRDATKITISPRAKSILYSAPPEVPLLWPSLGSDELFFTFAQWGYDKVVEIEYPYEGVWLHRDKDLIVEHPMSADEKSLNVHPGHVFEFVGQELLRQDLPTSCPCDSPNSHEDRVRAMLRLSALVEAEYVILLPHPLRLPNWYFLL